MKLNLAELSSSEKQSWLQHAIAPRPIGLISTIDKKGNANLAPFSFFNLVSVNPPLVIFSPARRIRDNTTKHSFENLYEVNEAVIHIVNFEIVNQVSLASGDYPKEVDEFLKAGFTKEQATIVKPPMVKESPVKLECKVREIKPLGKEAGAGNLVIAEIVCMHVDEKMLNHDGSMIDQTKLHHVARLGADWYCKVTAENLFTVHKPGKNPGIGMDNLPSYIRNSPLLTGNDLARLACIERVPIFDPEFSDAGTRSIFLHCRNNKERLQQELCKYAIEFLDKNDLQKAWRILGKLKPVTKVIKQKKQADRVFK